MMRINPFRPNHPVGHGMFAGRLAELEKLERALLQTKAGVPVNFLITGERGIGKSSLLLYVKAIAELGMVHGPDVKFLVLDTDLDSGVTQLGLIRKVELALRRSLGETEKGRNYLRQAWEFVQRIEAAGVGLKQGAADELPDTALDEFAYSLAKTVQRVCDPDAAGDMFGARYDGVILLIDEADNAAPQLKLGSFLKQLSERVQRHGCDHFMIGVAGLPDVRRVLAESHPSAIRLFDEMNLDRLTPEDVRSAVDQAMDVASKKNQRTVECSDSGIRMLTSLSEGFPHFVQQFGYSAFEADADWVIDGQDVMNGGFGSNGALELIGNRYYRDNYYERIKKDSYRQVLRIMAEHLDRWVTKQEIRAGFKGDANTLDNAIYALRKRHLIVSQEGSRGVYRLQNKGFAWWIKIYATPPNVLVSEADSVGEDDEDLTLDEFDDR